MTRGIQADTSVQVLGRPFELAFLGGLLLASTAIGLLWLLSIPFHEAPDEAAHLQVVRFILDHGRLPRFHPDDLWLIRTPTGVVETYAAFPPLAYLLMAAVAIPFGEHQMWAARLTSLACYIATVALTFVAARRMAPSSLSLAVWSSLAVALLPQLVFTGAYVNNDALGVLLSALLWYLLVGVWSRNGRTGAFLAIGVTAGALLTTKYTFYAVALVGLLSALSVAVRQGPRAWWTASALLVGVAGASGWWFAHNWALYAELIPGRVIAEAKGAAGGNTLFQPAEHGITLVTLSTETNFWELTLKSFVAGFGFMDVFLRTEHYLVAAGIGLLGLVGLIGLRRGPLGIQSPGLAATFLAGLAATLLSTMAISAYGEYSPQGRYLFGPLVPLAIALASGWVWLSRHAWLRWVPVATGVGLLGLNLVGLFGYVLPQYYGATPTGFLVQIDRPSTPQRAEAPIEVLGWALVTGGVPWHPFRPDVVTSYRRPVDGVEVYVDGPPGEGAFWGKTAYGFPRRDVRDMYGGPPGLERVGFRLVLPVGALEPGPHLLFACAEGGAAPAARCTSRPIEVL